MCCSTIRLIWSPLTSPANPVTCSTASWASTSPASWADPGTEHAAIDEAVTKAYRKSGEVVLVLVAIAAAAWGFFVVRARRRRTAGYSGLDGGEELEEGLQLNGVKRNGNRDR